MFSALLAACEAPSPAGAVPTGGTLVIGAVADADLLLPPVALTGTALQVTDAIFERLVQPTMDETADTLALAPGLATSWRWHEDSSVVDFTLDSAARWHDGVPVTAEDVRFTFAAYRDSTVGAPSREGLAIIDSVQVTGPHALRMWLSQRHPRAIERTGTDMRILPRHLLDSIPRARWRASEFSRRPVGSGRFRFAAWQAGTRLEVVADTGNHRGRPRMDRIIWTVAPDPATAIMRLRAGDVDLLENVRPDAVQELAATPAIKVVRSPGLAYGYVQWNLTAGANRRAAHPLFGDRMLRVALAHAIDRATAVRLVFDSLAVVAEGPFTRLQLAATPGGAAALSSPAYDTVRAASLLDSLGWHRRPDGIRTRQGQRLAFTILVPASSTPRVRLATLLQPMFKAIGADVTIESLEFPTFMARLAAGEFDAAVMAIGADLDPTAISGVWGSAAAPPNGGPNFGSYRSAAFDSAVRQAATGADAGRVRLAMREAYRIILADAPALWLFEPFSVSAMRRDIQPVGMRPDAWWSQLAEWSRTPLPASRP